MASDKSQGERIAALETRVEVLINEIEKLCGTVQNLNDTLNRGKGAFWLVTMLMGGAGAGIWRLFDKFNG